MRERERERERDAKVYSELPVCVCLCVCASERERGCQFIKWTVSMTYGPISLVGKPINYVTAVR